MTPRHPTVGLLALVPDDWDTWWQRRHHVLSRMGRHFHTAWVAPPRHWTTRRPPRRAAVHAPPDQTPHVVTDSRRGPPTVYHPSWLRRLHAARRVEGARKRLADRGCRTVILQIWRPEFREVVDLGAYDVTCYVIDDEYTWTPDASPTAAERRLIAEVHHVFIHSPGLMETKGHINPRTTLSPNGVDFAAHASPSPEPAALAAVPHPRVGYVGVLKPTLDWELLAHLADRRGDWSFVLMGPRHHPADVARPLDDLASRPNAFVLPPLEPRQAAACVQHLDVGIMPYRHGTHMTRFGSPLKLHEYLAAGLPAVGSPLVALEPFRDLVTLAATPAEWESAIEAALQREATAPERIAARRATAAGYDWDVIVDRMAEELEGHLPPPAAS